MVVGMQITRGRFCCSQKLLYYSGTNIDEVGQQVETDEKCFPEKVYP